MQRLMYQVIAIVFLVGQLILSPLSMIQASAAYAPEVAHDGTTIETSADIETTEATDPEIESDPASDMKEGEPNQSPENEQTTEGETQAPNLETPGEEGNDPAPLPETVDDEQKLQDESSSEEVTEDETEEATEEEDEDRTAQDEVSDGQLLSAGQLDFHFGSMVIGNETVTDAASAEKVRPKSGESVKVNYNFKLDTNSGNAPIQEGDYFTFQLPQALLVFDETSLSGTIGTQGAMFNYKTDGNGQVTVTSLQEIKTGHVTGNLTFGAHFSLDGASDDFEQNLEIPIQGKETITIPLTFYPAFDEGIEKTGEGPKGEPNGKDDLINWTVHINPSPASTESVEVSDKLNMDYPSGAKVKHEYHGPITIKKYKLDVHGNKEEVSTKTAESFPLTLEKEEGPYVFELTYQTKVNVEQYVLQDDANLNPTKSKYTFKNSVTYNGETATDNVDIFYEDEKPDLPLTKSMSTEAGDDSQLRYSYEVVYNPNAEHGSEELEEGANVITDVLTKGSELYEYDKDSFRFFVRYDENDEEEIGNSEGLTINGSSFTYEIPKDYEDEVIVIQYDVVYKNGDYFTEIEKEGFWIPGYSSPLDLANEVEIDGVKKGTSHKNKEQQYLKKSVDEAEIDYVNQEIKWTIHGKVPKGAKEFTIEDTFKPKEEEYGPHTLVEGSIELNGLNATVTETRDDGFTISVNGPFENQDYTISYRTKYELNEDFETYQRYGNTAEAQWKGPDGREYDVEAFKYHEFKTNNPASKNGYKKGSWAIDSSNFEMEWKVGINTNFHSLQGAVVTDTLSNNHVLIPETLEVYELNLAVGNSEGTKGNKVTSGYTKEVNDHSWKVTFTEDTNKAYLITYKTKDQTGMHVKDEDAKKLEYKNEAKLDIPGLKEQTYDQKLEWKTPDQFIEKSVTGNENAANRLLTWTIELNKSLSNLGETVITDHVSDNQMLLEGSFQLIPYYADKNTRIKEATDQARKIDVGVSNDKKSFTFTEDLAHKGYKLVYQTYYLGGHDEAISNTASMAYQGTTKDSQVGGSGDETKFTFNRSEGDVGYDTGTLKIEKRGEHNGTDLGPIANVHFTLQTTSGLKLYEGITDQNGHIEFPNLGYGTYQLVEQTPEGYESTGPQEITFGSEHDVKTAEGTPLIITNESLTPEKPEQPKNVSYEVLKVDADTKEPLEGVKFELRNEAGEEIRKGETNAQGKLTFTNVPEGKYVFVETQALDGYEASTKHYEAEAGGTITVKNKKEEVLTPTPETMTVKLTKVDAKDEEKLLPGATFKLYQVVAEGEDVLVKNGDSETFVTDENGTITVTDLEKGDYYFVEVEAPKGYVLDETPKHVNDDGTLVVKNEKETAPLPVVQQVLLEKVDAADANIPLEGAEFELFNAAGQSQGKYTTDENGKILINGLPKDDYYFVETKAPEGYQLSTEKHHVNNLRVTVKNEKQCEDFTVTVKEDGKPVEKDTEYTFESEDGETKVTATTDENGKIVIEREKLPKGKYTVTDKDGNKVGEIEVEYDECETELDIKTDKPGGGGGEDPKDPEEPTTPTDPETPEQCEDFTVTVKEDGKPVKKDTEYTFTSEDGKTTVTEKTDKDGKLVIDREKLPEGKYTVTDKDGNKVGEIEVEYDECGTELDMTTEEPTTPTDPETPEQCEDFTVTVKEDGKPVKKDTEYTFTSEDGKTTVTEKTDKDGKLVIDREKLPEGKYTVTDKDGNKVGEIEVEYDECGTELDMTTEEPGGGGGGTPPTDPEEPTKPTDPEAPEQCEDFTVTVKEDGKPVEKDTEYTFESEDGKTTVTEKTDKDGKIVIDREELPEGKYTVTDKDGNKVGEIEVEYDECGTELDMTTEEPGGGGGTPPTDPEEPTKPTDPEAPEQCEDFTVTVKEDGKPVEKDTEYTFESEDGKTTVTEKTDKDGKIVIDREELPEGKYTVTDKDGNKVGEIEVEYDECGTELDVTKKPADDTVSVTLVKHDANDENKRLAGATFDLFTQAGEKVGTYTTDEHGTIVVTDLAQDEYYFVETKAPKGYKLTKEKQHVLFEDGNPTGQVKVANEEDSSGGGGGGGNVDPEKPKPEPGPEPERPIDPEPTDPTEPEQCEDFTVTVKENGKPVKEGTEYTFESEDGETKVTGTTDKNGTIVIDREKLPEGKYTVTDKDGNKVGEIEVEYKECGTELDVKEDQSGGGGGEDPKDPEKPTTPTDPETPEQCEDFTVVVKEDGKPVEKDTEYTFESEDGETKVTAKTDENGTIVIDREELPEGKYTVTDKDGNKVGEIEVEYDECGTELDIKTEGSSSTGKTKVTLTKVDHKDETLTLEGAAFELYKKVDNGPDQLVMNGSSDRFVTDENGEINVVDLAEGDYYFVEKKAPKGYQLNRKAQDFKVVENEAIALTVTNKKRPSGGGGGGSVDPDKPGTDEDGETPTDEDKPGTGEDGETPTDEDKPGTGEDGETPTDEDKPGTGEDGETPTDEDKPGTGEDGETPTDEDKPGTGEDGETPTDEDKPGTGKPTKPEGNGTVGKPTPSGPATPGKTESNQTDSKGSKLPQTGEEQFIALIGFGALFVAFGGWLFFRNRRKEEQK